MQFSEPKLEVCFCDDKHVCGFHRKKWEVCNNALCSPEHKSRLIHFPLATATLNLYGALLCVSVHCLVVRPTALLFQLQQAVDFSKKNSYKIDHTPPAQQWRDTAGNLLVNKAFNS